MKKRISSIDVAREAGVSRATVSYVLNNVKGVKIKPQTRERVLEAARKLGYHPHSIARAMKTGRSMSVGVVSHWDVGHQRFGEMLRGIKEVLSKEQYSITLCSDEPGEQDIPEYLRYYLTKRIDGLILISSGERVDKKTIQAVKDNNIPAVFMDYHIKEEGITCIDIDYYHGAYIATKYLIENRYRQLVYTLPDIDNTQEQQRFEGVKQAIRDAGPGKADLRVLAGGKNEATIMAGVERLLDSGEEFDAIITTWYTLGFKTLYLANQMSIKVPEQMAVISLGGSLFADYTYPRLSTSDLPSYEIGRKSAQVFLNIITGGSGPVRMSLPCRLHIRESC